MSKKGLIGAAKYSTILLTVFLIAFLSFNYSGFAVDSNSDEGPFLNDTSIVVTNVSGSLYTPLNNFGFQINVTNNTEPSSMNIPGAYNISNCTFATNLTTGSPNAFENITAGSENVTTFTNNTGGIWWVNFTQERISGAGTYYYYWSCNLTNNTFNHTTNQTYTIAQNTAVIPTLTNDSYVNKTHSVTWLWANVTTDLDTAWCGYSMNNSANVSMTNATGNWYTNISAVGDGIHNITYWCNNTNTNYTTNGTQTDVYNFSIVATAPILSSGEATGYLTSNVGTITVTTNENAVCRYATTAGIAYGSMDSDYESDSGILHSWSVPTSSYTTYSYFIRCNDTYGKLTTTDYPINFTKTSSELGGSTGSGGITVQQTVEITEIDAGKSKTMSFTDQDLDVTKVIIKAENDMTDVALKITKLSSLPDTIDDPTGVVYKYLNFAETRMDDDDIDNAKISFRVTKTWLEFNEIDPSTVVMQRWNDGWERLVTEQVSDDSNYYSYEATTPGFSYFIVGGETLTVDDTTVGTSTTGLETDIESNRTWLWVVVVLVVIGVVGYYYYENIYKKKAPWTNLHSRWKK